VIHLSPFQRVGLARAQAKVKGLSIRVAVPSGVGFDGGVPSLHGWHGWLWCGPWTGLVAGLDCARVSAVVWLLTLRRRGGGCVARRDPPQ